MRSSHLPLLPSQEWFTGATQRRSLFTEATLLTLTPGTLTGVTRRSGSCSVKTGEQADGGLPERDSERFVASTGNYIGNSGSPYAILGGKMFVIDTTGCVLFSDGNDLGIGELPSVSPLRDSISNVFFVGAQKQMLGIDATPVIASVADTYSFRDTPEMDFPGETVGFSNDSALASDAISISLQATLPLPATVFLKIDPGVSPELDLDRFPSRVHDSCFLLSLGTKYLSMLWGTFVYSAGHNGIIHNSKDW